MSAGRSLLVKPSKHSRSYATAVGTSCSVGAGPTVADGSSAPGSAAVSSPSPVDESTGLRRRCHEPPSQAVLSNRPSAHEWYGTLSDAAIEARSASSEVTHLNSPEDHSAAGVSAMSPNA